MTPANEESRPEQVAWKKRPDPFGDAGVLRQFAVGNVPVEDVPTFTTSAAPIGGMTYNAETLGIL